MQPRIVGIISSPSRSGNTALLVRKALQSATERGADVEGILLPAHKLHDCTGCFHCMSEGGCPVPDDFLVRRFTLRNIPDNREDHVRAVYENLGACGLIKPAEQSQQLEEQLASC